MINPQDNTLIVQAAIKNLATNGVFYFGIPVAMEVRYSYSVGEEKHLYLVVKSCKGVVEADRQTKPQMKGRMTAA